MRVSSALITRNVAFAVLGAAVLVFKPLYRGPFEGPVCAWAGSFSVSFALYFSTQIVFLRRLDVSPWTTRLVAAGATLAAVTAFEATDGFWGAMGNTYDPADFIANAAGVAIAVLADLATSRFVTADREPPADA
jgi:hypothetical protein